MDETEVVEKCPECFGLTIQFTGKGKNMQYRVCSKWQEPGHKTETEVNQIIHQVRTAVNPSGRLA